MTAVLSVGQEATLAQLRAAAALLTDAGFPSTGRRVAEIADELAQEWGI